MNRDKLWSAGDLISDPLIRCVPCRTWKGGLSEQRVLGAERTKWLCYDCTLNDRSWGLIKRLKPPIPSYCLRQCVSSPFHAFYSAADTYLNLRNPSLKWMGLCRRGPCISLFTTTSNYSLFLQNHYAETFLNSIFPDFFFFTTSKLCHKLLKSSIEA